MNKELIKKYKEEFDHWLDGGSLLLGQESQSGWQWVVPTIISWNNKDVVYIISDEYVEFRKALAEGKSLQANQSYDEFEGQPSRWEDIPSSEMTEYCVDFLRIKPEEPELVVGDWVVPTNLPNPVPELVTEELIENCNTNPAYYGYVKWKPIKGEWYWFYNRKDKKPPDLRQFDRICPIVDTNYITIQGGIYGVCEPIIGQLPLKLKKG